MSISLKERRKILKTLAALGITPLIIPGCSWIFSKKKKTTLESSFYIIGKNQNTKAYGVYDYEKDKVKSIESFPAGFVPYSTVWDAKDKVFITAQDYTHIFVFDIKKQKQESISLSSEVTCGPSCFWEKDNSILTPQKSTTDNSIQLVVRDAKDLKEKNRFPLDKCYGVSDLKVLGEDIIVLNPSDDPAKKAAQILAYSLTDKQMIYFMMINQPFQPSFLEVHDGHCYIGLQQINPETKAYQAAPMLHFNTVNNTQKFLWTKSNRVNGGMIKTHSAAFSVDKKVLGVCHEEGKQVTFWSTENQDFFGMLKLDVEPLALTATEVANEFILSLKNAPAKIVQVSFDKIELKDFGKFSIFDTRALRKI